MPQFSSSKGKGGSTGAGRAASAERKPGLSSIFLISVEAGKKAYRYDVKILVGIPPKRQRTMTGGSVDLNRRISSEVLGTALKKSGRLPAGAAHVYDGRQILYTSEALQAGLDPVTVTHEDMCQSRLVIDNYGGTNFEVEIVECQTGHRVLDLNDLAQYQPEGNSVDREDRSLRTFFELAIAQKALESDKYMAIGSGRLFNRIGNGGNHFWHNHITFHSGLCKGVKIVKGISDRSQAAVVLDTKLAAFLKPQTLDLTISDFLRANGNNWQKLGQFLRGVKVQCAYNRSRIITVAAFGNSPLSQETFDQIIDDRTVPTSVVEYLESAYPPMKLKKLHLPGVIPFGKPTERFPAEQLIVMDGQKIPGEKQTPSLVEILLLKNTIAPQQRRQNIERSGKELALWNADDNNVLRAFGIKVDQKSNDTSIELLPLPNVQYKSCMPMTPSGDKGEWSRNNAYIDARAPKKWAVLYLKEDETIVRKFADKLKEKCKDKGMPIGKPAGWARAQDLFDANTNAPRLEEWEKCFEFIDKEGVDFLLLIDPKKTDSHGLLKLYEALSNRSGKLLLTQHVTLEVVKNVIEGNAWQTMDNIVNKLNVKFGGLNYRPVLPTSKLAKYDQRFDLNTGDILVIGYDVSHPTQKIHENNPKRKKPEDITQEEWEKMRIEEEEKEAEKEGAQRITSTEPSVVGICANMAENPHNFVGDYFYQAARKESLDMRQLTQRSMWILATLQKNRPRMCRPKLVFILRDGLSEGQYNMAYREELEAIKDGFRQHDPAYAPKFVLVIGTKRHFKKFYALDEHGVENMPPGAVIPDKVVRPDITEFYMQTHFAIKGTSKTVEYAVLTKDIDFGCDMNQLKEYLKLIQHISEATHVGLNFKEYLGKRMFRQSLYHLLMQLSFDHQIVNKPISLTEPVYQADELATRGHSNFQTLKHYFPESVRYVERNGQRRVDTDALNETLSYWNNGQSMLKNRFTA